MDQIDIPKVNLPDFAQISRNLAASTYELSEKVRHDQEQRIYSLSAKHVFDVIRSQIREIESTLDSEHEAALQFASFGQAVTMSVETIGFKEPHFIYFSGTVNGQKANLVQHMSQLNFLTLVVKTENERPARRIGFGNG